MAKSLSNKQFEQSDTVTNTFLTTPASGVKTNQNLLEESSVTLPIGEGTIGVDGNCSHMLQVTTQ